jgi:hypothetical protein
MLLLTYSHATLLPRLPIGRLSSFLSLAIGVGATLAAIADMQKRKDLDWIFFAGVLCFAPAVAAIASLTSGAPPVTLRYFLVGLPFLMLAVSYTLGQWIRSNRWGAVVGVAVVAASLSTNSELTLELLKHGRGGYSDALDLVAERSESPRVFISSNNDVRNGTLIRFYAERRGKELPRIIYMPRSESVSRAPDWYVSHSFLRGYRPVAKKRVGGEIFERVGTFAAGPFSGWPWHLYQRTSKTPAAD